MKHGVIILCLAGMLISSAAQAGSTIRNGGDMLEVGKASRIFDEVEFSRPFFPQDHPKSWEILNAQLTKLEGRLPRTGRYLRSMFERGRITWTFVDVKLVDVKDEGATNIALTMDGDQAAVNTGNIVQISTAVWDKLDDLSKAVLEAHEATWIANGVEALQDGSTVRKLVGVLFDPKLNQYGRLNLANTLLAAFPDALKRKSSKFVQKIEEDLRTIDASPGFLIDAVVDAETTKTDVLVVAQLPKASIDGMHFTPFNPKRSLGSLRMNGDELSATAQGVKYVIGLDELCGDLSYGNLSDWELVSLKDLYTLHRHKFERAQYTMTPDYPESLEVAEIPNQQRLNQLPASEPQRLPLVIQIPPLCRGECEVSVQIEQWPRLPQEQPKKEDEGLKQVFLYPSGSVDKEYRLITQGGFVVNLGKNMRMEPASFNGPVYFICKHRAIGFKD